jgi:hypothetical protein
MVLVASLLTLVNPRLGVAVWVITPFLGITMRRKQAKSVLRQDTGVNGEKNDFSEFS